MPRDPQSRLRLLRLIEYLRLSADREHPASFQDVIAYMEQEGIHTARSGIDSDLAVLSRAGYPLEFERGDHNKILFYLRQEDFTIRELKILIEAVQTSRYLTEEQTRTLIDRLEALTSKWNKKDLHKQVKVYGRSKSLNPATLDHAILIHRAINLKKKISFKYMQWNVKKEYDLKGQGRIYSYSPCFLTQDRESLYMVVYNPKVKDLTHFRVDKMCEVKITQEDADPESFLTEEEIATYTNRVFGMFSGRPVRVKLSFDQNLTGVAIDRFGRQIDIRMAGEGQISFHVDVMASPQFYAFLAGLRGDAKILEPAWVQEEYREFLMQNLKACEDDFV